MLIHASVWIDIWQLNRSVFAKINFIKGFPQFIFEDDIITILRLDFPIPFTHQQVPTKCTLNTSTMRLEPLLAIQLLRDQYDLFATDEEFHPIGYCTEPTFIDKSSVRFRIENNKFLLGFPHGDITLLIDHHDVGFRPDTIKKIIERHQQYAGEISLYDSYRVRGVTVLGGGVRDYIRTLRAGFVGYSKPIMAVQTASGPP